jgi:hypothetical protein
MILRPVPTGPNSFRGMAVLMQPFGIPSGGLVLREGNKDVWSSRQGPYQDPATSVHAKIQGKPESGYPFSRFFQKVKEV